MHCTTQNLMVACHESSWVYKPLPVWPACCCCCTCCGHSCAALPHYCCCSHHVYKCRLKAVCATSLQTHTTVPSRRTQCHPQGMALAVMIVRTGNGMPMHRGGSQPGPPQKYPRWSSQNLDGSRLEWPRQCHSHPIISKLLSLIHQE